MSAVQSERDYGSEAIKRRLGILAKERREAMGMGRPAFAELAGLGSDSTVQQFEFGQRWPRPQTLRKLETALGWRYRITEDLLEDPNRAASSITLEELSKPAEQPAPRPMSSFSTPELMRELAHRLDALQEGMGAVREPLWEPTASPLSQADFDVAAEAADSSHHMEGEDERD